MSIQNLRENAVYERLPEALISLDERGLMQAVLGGYQDRLEDLRSYGRKLNDFFTPLALPDPTNNVVLVDLQSDQGKAYTRSLDFSDTTPEDGTAALTTWAAKQLGLDVSEIANVRYGRDLLRVVDTNILDYLAASIGAVLYQSALIPDAELSAAHGRLVETYFPRLKIKGTASSFEYLGRILGFDDVRYTPLWSRVSPRKPEDIGNPSNDADFSLTPDFYPRQELGPYYNPLKLDDGPFYTWAGTVSNGTGATDFYTTVINRFSPFVTVSLQGSINGTNLPSVVGGIAVHPTDGSYALSGGNPYTKATAEPVGSSFKFTAIADGDSFNGLYVNITTVNGTLKVVHITDRLSSIKYRSSFFDLGLTADMDKIEEIFGSSASKRNKDLAAGLVTPDGPAVSPFRPWTAGSIAVGTISQDFLTLTVSGSATSTIIPRHEALASERQLNYDAFSAAGVQVAQSFEEVRAATRLPRRTATGLLITDTVPYACYDNQDNIFTTTVQTNTGSFAGTPYPDFIAAIGVQLSGSNILRLVWPSTPTREYQVQTSSTGTGSWMAIGNVTADQTQEHFYAIPLYTPTSFYRVIDSASGSVVTHGTIAGDSFFVQAVPSINPVNPDQWFYRYVSDITNFTLDGNYNFATGTYSFVVAPLSGAGVSVNAYATWTLTDTEVIRPEPSAQVKYSGTLACLARPEDDEEPCEVITVNGTFCACLLDEVVDEFPWRRDIVIGGELVELDSYLPQTPDEGVDELSDDAAFLNHEGVDMNVFVIYDPSGHHRMFADYRSYDRDDYQPGRLPIAYVGSFRDLASYTALSRTLINNVTDLDTVFLPGYSIYHAGVVQNVVVADAVKFNGVHHRQNLVAWFPFNEHALDDFAVNDRSTYNGFQYLTNITHTQRLWTDQRGWALKLKDSDAIQSLDYRAVAEATTVAFWVNTDNVMGSGMTTVFEYGALTIDIDNATSTFHAYVRRTLDNTRVLIGSAPSTSGWTFLYLRKDATNASFGYGTLAGMAGESTVVQAWNGAGENDALTIRCGSRPFYIHDFRLWNTRKTAAEMNLVRYHAPTSTMVNYRLGFIYSANRQDRYGMRVLPSGWITPAELPPWYRTVRQALVRRYDSLGRYTGETRTLEVGLGGGRPLPSQFQLGSQFAVLEGYGTAVVSTQHGIMPGINQYWLNNTATGVYITIGSSSSGTGTNTAAPMVGTLWPVPMVQTNPCREFIWLRGDDNYVYETKLDGTFTNTNFVTKLVSRDRTPAEVAVNPIYGALLNSGTYYEVTTTGFISGTYATNGTIVLNTNGTQQTTVVDLNKLLHAEQPTGAEVVLAGTGYQLAVNTTGSVYQKVSSGTISTPPLYMYATSRIVAAASSGTGAGSILQAWTENGATADDFDVVPNDLPSIVDSNGILQVPVLGDDGVLEFQNTGTITPGRYRLTVESGNIGRLDSAFDGFITEITVDNTILARRLLAGQNSFNVRGEDIFEFDITTGVIGTWILSFNWTNSFRDPTRGTMRQLALYSYSLRKLDTELFRVTINGANTYPTVTPLIVTPFQGTTPGGWLFALNSYGTVSNHTHESVVYPSNDTVTSRLPISGLLTGATNDRREDILVGTVAIVNGTGTSYSTEFVLRDGAGLEYPSFGTAYLIT